jgi:dTDP-4-amino-4,6-dideoxy-D-glucose transaminase
MQSDLPAILGGAPVSQQPLHIVRPRFPALEEIADRFRTALATGAVTNHGPAVAEFEAALARYMNVPEVVVTNNGQSALLVMLRGAGIDSGEVIVPAFTFSATPHAVKWCGATPVFADSDPKTLCIDPRDVEKRITPRTKAIVGVDVYGIACDYAALAELGRRHNVEIFYDSAPSFGAKVGGQTIGGFGRAQAFSFHATKAFATMEGGAVATKDSALATRARNLRNFGQSRGADCDEAGINAKMTEVCALIGLKQLEKIEADVAHRNRVAARYRDGLSKIPGLRFAEPPPDQTPVWLYFPVFVDKSTYGLDRNELAAALAAENLHVRKYFEIPCHQIAAYKSDAELPHAELAAATVVALPVYNTMTDDEADRFAHAVDRIHRHAARVRAALGEKR